MADMLSMMQNSGSGQRGPHHVNRAIALVLTATLPFLTATSAFCQDATILSTMQEEIAKAAKGWETTAMDAARSLFWTLATIEVGLSAVWLALQAATLESWFSELVRRIMFIGFFAFVMEKGPEFARSVVDSLFQLGGSVGSASPADVFNAGLAVAARMSGKIQFGLFENNALAISSAFAMLVIVICFSLVAALFVSVMAEMYVGLMAGMIMLGFGASSFTKDFAIRYLVYAFGVGMKLMALTMIARIGSDVLIGMADRPEVGDEFMTSLSIAGLSVIVFLIAIYVPNTMQGLVQGVSVTGGGEALRHGMQAASFAAGLAFLGKAGAGVGMAAARSASAAGASATAAAGRGAATGLMAAGQAIGAAAKEKAIGSPGARAGTLLGLANAKLDKQDRTSAPERRES